MLLCHLLQQFGRVADGLELRAQVAGAYFFPARPLQSSKFDRNRFLPLTSFGLGPTESLDGDVGDDGIEGFIRRAGHEDWLGADALVLIRGRGRERTFAYAAIPIDED